MNSYCYVTGSFSRTTTFGDTTFSLGQNSQEDMFLTRIADLTTSINSTKSTFSFKLFPNPTSSKIYLSSSSSAIRFNISVKNQLGQSFHNLPFSGQDELHEVIDFSNYPKGIYFIEITSGEVREVKKVVVN